ncbi:Flagellar biosynthetic protein FliR [Buchnera aphidicola (Eriosoma grossulariae)]|uniref:flagellar biosynthetic protein FliR n=1 Tax=Buchnera aphidicola TaxID=9 RepID=UPI003464D836
MLTVNSIDFFYFLNNILLPSIRILSLFYTAPIFSENCISYKIKIFLSIIISFLIFPFLPESHINFFSYHYCLIFIQQIIIGGFLGFIIKIVFSSVNMAGEIISALIGLSFSNYFDINSRNNLSSISRFLNILILFIFLTFNGHLWLISILSDSFHQIPIDHSVFNVKIFFILVQFSSLLFLNSLKLALPVIILLLILNCIMAFLNRISPQISIFSVGFPITLVVGIFTLNALIPISISFFKDIFINVQNFLFYIT